MSIICFQCVLGNTGFSSQDDDTALKCYNDALLAAPADPWDEQGLKIAKE